MSITVIIVNFRSAALIVQCLQSFLGTEHHFPGEIIVVDNGSGDDSEHEILSRFPMVRWVQMGYNAGFARANNEGIRLSKSDVVLLLNPDTIILRNAIVECASRMISSNYVAAGVQLLNEDGSPQISGNYFMWGGLNHLMNVPYTGQLLRWIGLQLKVKKTNVPAAQGTVEVDWINGAFLMVRRTALATAGLLDEDFFLYSEEIEWCSRLRKAGKLCIYGDLNVTHLVGKTADAAFKSEFSGYTELADEKGFQLMLSGFVRIRKQFGIFWFLFHLVFCNISAILAFLLLPFSILINPGKTSLIGRRTWGFAKNTMRSDLFLFRILSNRPYFYKVL